MTVAGDICKWDGRPVMETAYIQFLRAESRNNVNVVARLIKADFLEDGELPAELLKLTGDIKFTDETFLKAARLVLRGSC